MKPCTSLLDSLSQSSSIPSPSAFLPENERRNRAFPAELGVFIGGSVHSSGSFGLSTAFQLLESDLIARMNLFSSLGWNYHSKDRMQGFPIADLG